MLNFLLYAGGHTSVIDDLYMTIPMMLNSQLYGTPFVGSDICGYNGIVFSSYHQLNM